MPVIVIDVNTFTYDFPIYIVEANKPVKEIGYSTIEAMGETLTALCYSHQVDKVKIHGEKEYCLPIVEAIDKTNKSKYGYQKEIEIEVI